MATENKTIGEFISTLLNAKTQYHIYHLQVTGVGSYAAHTALNSLYDSVSEFADRLAEMYQGQYGIIKGYKCDGFKEDGKFIDFTDELINYIHNKRYTVFSKEDTHIQNVVDDLIGTLFSQLYKLKNLK